MNRKSALVKLFTKTILEIAAVLWENERRELSKKENTTAVRLWLVPKAFWKNAKTPTGSQTWINRLQNQDKSFLQLGEI